MAQHQAVFLDGVNQPLRIGPIDTKKPGPGEILVKTAAVAINPVDWKTQAVGVFITKWPTILGVDVAGEVVAVGEGVTRFSQGQRVIFQSTFLRDQRRPELGGFQELVVSPQASVAALPDSISYEAGVVVPLSVSSASAALFQSANLALDMPSPSTAPKKKHGKTLLVWGGSSSVGTSAIQLGVAAGYDVVTTASQSNFDLVKGLGAKAVVDHRSATVVADLVAELKKGGEFVGAFDAVSLRETQLSTARVVQELGGGNIATVLPPIEDAGENVTIKGVFSLTIFKEFPEVGKAIWQDFLPEALKSGQFKPSPPFKVAGKGLGSLQSAFDQQKAGVSGTKIVVTL